MVYAHRPKTIVQTSAFQSALSAYTQAAIALNRVATPEMPLVAATEDAAFYALIAVIDSYCAENTAETLRVLAERRQ